MIELLKEVFSEAGIVALALVAVLFIAGGILYILYILVRQKNVDDQTVSTQATVIAQLVKPMQAISEQLATTASSIVEVSGNMVKLAELLGAHDKHIEAVLDDAFIAMDKATEAQINKLPERIREEMAPDFQKLPKAIEDALSPQIQALKTGIAELIVELDRKLTDRLDAATDDIPQRTTALVRGELETMSDMINKSLRDMLETAQKTVAKIEDETNTNKERE